MLKDLRKKGVAKKVLWVIAGIIIISFGFGFGVSRYSSSLSMTTAVGKAFGKPITFKEFERYSYDTRDQAILMHGDNFRKIQHLIDMESETWTRILLVREADRLRIRITDPEVIAFIQSMPFFARGGDFDRNLYENILQHVFQRDPRAFEEGIRDQVKIMKLFRNQAAEAPLTEEMVKKEYERRNKKTQVSYVLIDPKAFAKDVPVSDADIQAYYEGNRADFLTPDSVNAAYLTVKVPQDATEADKAMAMDQAREIKKKITAETDLAALARENSLALKETGLISMEDTALQLNWPLELLQKIFSTKADAVLDPALTEEGIVIARIKELKPAYIPELDKIKDAVAKRIREDKVAALAQARAEEVHKELVSRLKAGATFDSAAKGLGQAAKKTPFFALGEYVPEIGISEDFGSAALGLNKEERLSGVVATVKGPAILYWEADESVDEKKFAEDKEDFTRTLNDETRVAAMNKVIREIKERAGFESYLDKFKKQPR